MGSASAISVVTREIEVQVESKFGHYYGDCGSKMVAVIALVEKETWLSC